MKHLPLLFIIALLTIVNVPVDANYGGGGAGGAVGTGTFHAVGTEEISMEKEELTIQLYQSYAHVTVDYVLKNLGKAKNVTAGFPYLTAGDVGVRLDDYSIKINGKEMSYTTEKGGPIPNIQVNTTYTNNDDPGSTNAIVLWLVSKAFIPSDRDTSVHIEYDSPYLYSHAAWSDTTRYDDDTFIYLISTGATWKGPIKKASIKIIPVGFRCEDIRVESPKMAAIINDGKTIQWELNDFEPSVEDDITIRINSSFAIQDITYASNIPDEIKNIPGEFMLHRTYKGGEEYWVDYRQGIYTARASSELNPQAAYGATNLDDSDYNSAWAEGVPGDGIGESIELELNEPLPVTQIGIIPGYAKSKSLYFSNNRVAKLKITLNNEYSIEKSLVDEYNRFNTNTHKDYQLIDLGPYGKNVRTIKLTIAAVYKGLKYSDTCVSEIMLRRKLETNPGIHFGSR